MSTQTRFLLNETDLPRSWYNINADMPVPPAPVLHPGTMEPVTPDFLAVLFPMGLFMGMAFPLGMKLASRHAAALTPWLWGINGAFSVLASVLAVAVALTWAISAAYWVGCGAYAVALAAFVQAARRG